jgi:sigma-B regulation protein RsbU (phosphoserine phosphatase)
MKRFSFSGKLIFPLLAAFFLLSLSYDLFKYYSSVNIVMLDLLSEFLMVGFAGLFYFYIRPKLNLREKSIRDILLIFLALLFLLYSLVVVIKLALNPGYSPATFPHSPESLTSVIYSNLIALLAILFMTPMLMALKNLIYYKRGRRTMLIMRLFMTFMVLTMTATVIWRAPLNFNFEDTGIYSNSLLVVTLVFVFFLSLRNSWITFLSQKEKVSYFFISLLLFWLVLYLFDFAFVIALPAHSLAIGVFANIIWYLMVSYILFGSLYLFLQLPTARVFDRKMKEVTSLHNLSREISSEFDFNRLVRMITEMTSEVIGSESTWLQLEKESGEGLYIVASHNLSDEHIRRFNDDGMINISHSILENRQALMVNEITRSDQFAPIRKWKADIGSLMGVPLISGKDQTRGILYAAKSKAFGFDPDDMTLLEAYAGQAVIALDNAMLLRQSIERERLEEELRIARDVQQRLLPQKTPNLKGVQIESLTITAYEVGGDYYDFFPLSNNHVGLIIGDVSGKGTSAAFYMAEAKGIVQSLSRNFSGPRNLLIKTNEILYDSMERKSFITLLMASLDCDKRELVFARAGHTPLVHYSASEKKVALLQPNGIGVGLDSGPVFASHLEEQTVRCSEGDIFILYTDGLSEARNPAGDEFGEERLEKILEQNHQKSAAELKDILIDAILDFLNGRNLADDLTLLLLKV